MADPDAESPGEEPRKEQTDWLGRLRGNMPAEADEPETSPTKGTKETADWLSRLHDLEDSEADDEAESGGWQPPPTAALSDEALAPPPPPEAGDVPDWLKESAIKTGSLQPTPPAQPEEREAEAPRVPLTEEVPDWLQPSLAAVQSPDEPPADEEKPVEDEPPGWLQATTLGATPAPEAPQAAAADDAGLPEWLSSEPGPEPESPAPAPPGTADLPGWLLAESEESEPDSTPIGTSDLPAWLLESEDSAAAGGTASLPDWIPGEPDDAATPAHAADDVIPDWLAGLTDAAPSLAGTDILAAEEEPETEADDTIDYQPSASENLPDWLEPGSAASAPPAAATEPGHVGDIDFSEFLVDTEAGAALPTAGEVTGDELPDWLADIDVDAPGTDTEAPALYAAEAGGVDSGTLDWLDSLSSTAEESPPTALTEESPSIFPESGAAAADVTPADDDLPDWLASVRPRDIEPAAPDTGQLQDMPLAADMPDWLAAMRPAGLELPDVQPPRAVVAPEEPATAEAASSALDEPAPAGASDADSPELPEWALALEEEEPAVEPAPMLQPVDDFNETAGPLAGMRGVIRAEPSVSLPGRAGESVANFTVTDWQKEQAAIFHKLMRAEIEDLPEAPKRKLQLPFAVDRLLVFLALALAVVAPFALEQSFFDTPNPEFYPSNRALLQSIADLPQNSLVLVAFDYDPGLGGELNDGMEALLVQLAERGQRFALVSTRPAGVGVAQAVAEAALARVEIDAAETYGVQYVNLGLIPGGAIGLQAFAADPVSVIDVDFIRGDSPWGMDVVAGVDSLSGFDMMVVATDSPAVGRGWLEQVRPQGVPMAAVVTGATQPLLQPYAEGDNPQFVGLSGGLAGAFVNDIIAPRGPSAVSRRWDSYSAGILAAGLLLLFGNVVWMTVRLARPESRSESSPGGTQL